MRFTISDIETKLESFFEGKLQSFFNINPLILLTDVLIEEFENSIQTKDGKRIAPNVFNIFIQEKDLFKEDELIKWKIFAHQLITELAQNNSCKLSGPVYLDTFFDETIKNKYVVSAAQSAPTSGKTTSIFTKNALLSDNKKLPNAFMILWNEKIYKITKNITNIGRRDDNDLVIDNLRVSRLHAQIRKTKGGFMLFDIDSTSGTKVNGLLIKQHQLVNGDVIEIADVPIIFSCDGNFSDKYPPRSAKTIILRTKTSGKIK
jgi:hypothetical protein